MSKINKFTIFCERCSGSNYLEELLLENTNLEKTVDFGWKHGYPFQQMVTNKKIQGIPKENVVYLVIIRNPYDWIRSLNGNRWHAREQVKRYNFKQFIRNEWKSVLNKDFCDEKNPEFGHDIPFDVDDNGKYHPTPMHLRTHKYKKVIEILKNINNFYIINYDQLKNYPEIIISDICKTFDIKMKPNFKNINHYKKNKSETYKQKNYNKFNPEDLDWINDNLDWNFEERFGYTKILHPDDDIDKNKYIYSDKETPFHSLFLQNNSL